MGSAGLPDAGRSPKAPAPPGIDNDAAAAKPQRGRWVFVAAAAVYAVWLGALAAAAIARWLS